MDRKDFDAESHVLLDWFKGLPGATFHENIRIVDLRGKGAGRAIVATADIPSSETLFTIPRHAVLCKLTSDLPRLLPSAFGQGNGASDDGADEDEEMDDVDEEEADSASEESWTSLIFILIFEYLQGSKSKWKPYLDVLPTAFDTPMFWNHAEMQELQASAVVPRTGKDQADEMIRAKILPTIRKHEAVFFPDGMQKMSDERLMELAHRMGSAIMAYSFDLEDNHDEHPNDSDDEDEWMEDREGKTMMGMVPMADVLNADAVFNACIDHEEHALIATAVRDIPAGEEILNYYGPLSNGELLRRYGYVTRNHSRYDVVELPWKLIEQRALEQLKMDGGSGAQIRQLHDEAGFDDFEDAFVLDWGNEEYHVDELEHAREEKEFKGLPDELEEQFRSFLKAAYRASPDTVSLFKGKKQSRRLFLECVSGALKDRMSEYGTTIAQDRSIQSRAALPGRLDMALTVRIGEKEILEAAQEWVCRRLEDAGLEQPSRLRADT